MSVVPSTIEAHQVQHLPIVKAYADKIGLVEVINQVVPTEMAIDAGTIVLGMILDTLSGRSPLYRLEEFFAQQDTALLLGKPVAPEAFDDDTVGRVLDRLYDTGTPYRAVVMHSSAQDKRRQQRLERELQASSSTVQAAARLAEQQEYFCRADAEAAAVKLRALPTSYHRVDVVVEERLLYGRGRPSPRKPRPIKARRYRLKTTVSLQSECMARREEEAGCFVLLTNVPTTGALAHNARAILTGYKEQHGTEQNYGFLKDPVIVNSLFLKKPERIEALGLILLLALLLWRLMERAMRMSVATTSTPLVGWNKKATRRPTSFMMVTKFAGVIVLKLGDHRQLARPLSVIQQQYLTVLDVPAAYFTGLTSG